MPSPGRILLVETDDVARSRLEAAADSLAVVESHRGFETARARLYRAPFDFLVTNIRLGAYNGLHVILRARADHPDVSAIVTTPVKNRGLEADARSLNIQCLIKPQSAGEWLEPVWKILNEDHADGRSSTQCDSVPSMGRI